MEYNNRYFRQNSGGPMGSPLTVALAEIRVSYLEEEALRTCPESPIHYYHFVDDGFGHFRNKIQADKFLEHLNSLSPDLDYTIEYPHPDGSIPFLDVLIHPDCSTSVYRKPTNTNLYTHYSSSSTMASKESVVRSLTRRAVKLCSSRHLKMELQHLEATFLSNGYPLQKIRHLMSQTIERTKSTAKPSKTTSSSTDVLTVSIPYYKSFASSL